MKRSIKQTKQQAILLLCLFNVLIVSLCNNPNLEWKDPESKTYYNISALKKDPK